MIKNMKKNYIEKLKSTVKYMRVSHRHTSIFSRRKRRKRTGCLGCGTCIIPFLLCIALLVVFRDRYPITALTDFMHDPILSTVDDSLISVIESVDDTSSELPMEEDVSVPTEAVQEDSVDSPVVMPDTEEVLPDDEPGTEADL